MPARFWDRTGPLVRRNQAHSQSVTHQARHIVQIQTFHQFHAMILHSFWADLENVANLLGILTFCNQLKNLALPSCQLINREGWTWNCLSR